MTKDKNPKSVPKLEDTEEGNIVPLRKIPTVNEARNIARTLSQQGLVKLSGHAREKMAERDINFDQILTCLEKGIVAEGPYETFDGWKATFKRVAAGELLHVECVMQFTQKALIVTVY